MVFEYEYRGNTGSMGVEGKEKNLENVIATIERA